MRRRLALLTTSVAVALGAAIVNPSPALARNIGGFGGECTLSPGTVLAPKGSNPGTGAYCLCVIEPNSHEVLAGVTGPGSKCPPGILRLQPPNG